MDNIFMSTKNSKTSDYHKLLLSFSDKTGLKRNDEYFAFAFSNLGIYYIYIYMYIYIYIIYYIYYNILIYTEYI